MEQGQNGLLPRGADGQPEARRRDPWVHWGRKYCGGVGVGVSAQRGHRAVGEVKSGQQPQAYKGACDSRCLVRP